MSSKHFPRIAKSSKSQGKKTSEYPPEITSQPSSKSDILHLQHVIGNHATQQVLSRSTISPLIHQTAPSKTIQRTTSDEFLQYLGNLEDKGMGAVYKSRFFTWSMAFEDIDKEIKPLSNESVLEKMLVGFQLNGLTMKKYYETNGDTEGLKYFNLWNRLVNPNLSTMTLVQVKEQVKLLSHRDVHEIESEIQQLDKKRWIQQYQSKPVFQELVKDIRLGDDPAVQLNQLLLNFKRIGPTNFAYTMDATSYENFLNGTKGGDCNTLVHAFKAIAENYLGLPVKNNDSGKIGFPPKFKTPRKETIDGVSGNVDAGKFWVFENHFWIEYEGETYDVLFGVKEHVNSSSWIKMTAKENGAEVYEGTKVWINPSRSDTSTRYTTTDPN